MALVAWLSAALFPTAGTETARARLLQAVAARGLAAVAAVFPLLGLNSGPSCLEVEDDSSQRTHQGQYGFFALLVGGMDIVWGRQTLGCHDLYYAPLLSALHEGMITLLVCLSSYQKDMVMASKRCKAAAGSAVPHPGLPERPREPREGLYSQPHRTDAGTVMRLSTDELVRLAPKLRAYLPTPIPTWPDIVDTAHWLRHDLDVSKPLWGEACMAMGARR
jgi:hypothetical protein